MLSTLRQRSAAHATPTSVMRGELGNQRAPGAMRARCGSKENAPEGIMRYCAVPADLLMAWRSSYGRPLDRDRWRNEGLLAAAYALEGPGLFASRVPHLQMRAPRLFSLCWTWLAKQTPQVASELSAPQKLTAIKENEGRARVLCRWIVRSNRKENALLRPTQVPRRCPVHREMPSRILVRIRCQVGDKNE